MRRAVMAGFVAPDALLLVPFFAIAAECLEPFTALPGIKPANRKRVSRAALMASSLRCLGATRASIRASRSLSTNRSMCVRDDPIPLPGCRGGRCGSPRCNLPSGLSGLRCPGHSPFRTSAGRQLMSQTDPFGHQRGPRPKWTQPVGRSLCPPAALSQRPNDRLVGVILASSSSCPTERFALIPLKRPSIKVKVSGYRLNEDDFRAAV
jgi:hypothetical protein